MENQSEEIYLKAREKFDKGRYEEVIKIIEKTPINKEEERFQNLLDACYQKLDEIIYNNALSSINNEEYLRAIYILEEKAKTNAKFKELLDKATQGYLEMSYDKAIEYLQEKNIVK